MEEGLFITVRPAENYAQNYEAEITALSCAAELIFQFFSSPSKSYRIITDSLLTLQALLKIIQAGLTKTLTT